MQSEKYDVTAKAEGNVPFFQMAGPMLQALLEERFQLKIHRETKVVAVLILSVANGGLKLEPTKEGSCVSIDPNHLPPPPEPGQSRPNICGNLRMGRNASAVTITSHGTTMEELVSGPLARLLGRPVLDKTGVTGRYEIQLEFAADTSMPEPPARAGANDTAAPAPLAEPVAPSIFSALQKLGLKLEPGKGPVEVLVIDHVERPSEN